MRLSDDLAAGSPTRESSGGVDWAHYESLYKAWWSKQSKLEQAQSAKVISEEPQDAVIFGGG